MHSDPSPLWLGARLGGAYVHSTSAEGDCLDPRPIQFHRRGSDDDSNPHEPPDDAERDGVLGWREARIARLRRAIRAGEYRVDVGRLARRLFRILGS